MASIYKKVPLYKVVKTWDNNNPNLSEVYKLLSNDSRNKSQVKIHKDNGKYGIKFTIDKTIPEFNKGAEKMQPFGSLRMCSRATTKRPGNRCFTSTFQSPSMQLCQYQLCRITVWKKTSIKQFSSLFSKRWTRKSLGIGSISTCNPAETTSSRNWWCSPPWNIFDDSKRWSGQQRLSQQETCIRPTKRCSLNGFTCLFIRKTGWSMWKVVDILLMRCSSHLPSILITSPTHR